MKTIKILTIIGGLMLLSATVFSQEPEKKNESKTIPVYFAYNSHSNSNVELNAEYFEIREAFNNLKELADKISEELKYDANDFIEKELQEEQSKN